jgi:hypothetical protein
VKAFEYFTKAAQQDNGDAQIALGKCYLKGRGTAMNKEKANAWFLKAAKNESDGPAVIKELKEEAANGDPDAKYILQVISKK